MELVGVGLVATLVAGGIGWWFGWREAGQLAQARVDALLEALGNERALRVSMDRERQGLVDQLVRIQRSSVGLDERTPPQYEVPEKVEPPEELVKLCHLFESSGTTMLRDAMNQYRKGVPWQWLIEKIRQDVIANGGEDVLKVLDEQLGRTVQQ